MSDDSMEQWTAANQRYLMASLAVVRAMLERHIARASDDRGWEETLGAALEERDAAAAELEAPSALDTLVEAFELSPFERDLLLLCAGPEYSGSFAALCGTAQGESDRHYPTLSLALSALDGAYWGAIVPTAPLRYWKLIEIGSGTALTSAPIRIDEWALHYLAGVEHFDERLAGVMVDVDDGARLVPSHAEIARRMAHTWSRGAEGETLPILQLCGDEIAGKRSIAGAACEMLGLTLSTIPAAVLPNAPADLDILMRLWEREAVVGDRALFLDCDDFDPVADPTRDAAVNRLVENCSSPVIVSSRARRRGRLRPVVTYDVVKPTGAEQMELWRVMLGDAESQMRDGTALLVSQFNLNAPGIEAACADAVGRLGLVEREDTPTIAEITEALWDGCRAQARPRLDDLAQHIVPVATWDDLVLPEVERSVLRDVALHVRHRGIVYDQWGFAGRGSRGLGISALFAGASGTGKTMAAEVLAHELRLDLYRIDLSAVVSKYIGETEKNLRLIFDAAEEGGAILLFDEADALFGKRSEVKDSHDRHANIEVSYLLQRMEAYRGLAILTTNLKEALDTAFLRRIRFIVQFPFPDMTQRAEIWRRIFPRRTPVENLDATKLARLNVAGGNIRNIALNAAFLAAESGGPVRMEHLLHAAKKEYTKLEKPLTETEIRGWI